MADTQPVSLALDKMEISEGIRLVLRRARLLEEDEPLETVSAATRTAALHLVEELDGLPLALYRQHRLALLQRASSTSSDYPYTVASTWTLSFSRVEQANPAAVEVLRACAFLHPDAIPEEVLTQGAAALGPHMQHVASKPLLLAEHPDVAQSLNSIAELYRKQGKYEEAEPLYLRTLAIREKRLGPESPETARSLNNLAALYDDQGKYAEAEPLCERALHIREQQLGPEHPDVADSLNNLANLYLKQGKYKQVEPLYQRTLHIREQQLGPKHPYTAETMYDLARYLAAQGNNEEARTWYTRALAIREEVYGARHLKTTQTRTGLIDVLHAMGRHEDAARLEADLPEQDKSEEEQKIPSEE